MNKHIIPILLAAMALNACSGVWRENRRASAYADKIEQSEGVTAYEYSEMVSFYCTAIDHALEELRPYHEAHAAALEGANREKVSATERELTDKTRKVAESRKDVTRLGTRLLEHMTDMPDTTSRRLRNYIFSLHSRYSE